MIKTFLIDIIELTSSLHPIETHMITSFLTTVVALFSTIGFAFFVTLIWVRQRETKIKAAIDTQNTQAAADLLRLQDENKKGLKGGGDGKGYEGELRLIAAITKTLDRMGVKHFTHLTQGFADAIILPKGYDRFSKEIDLLLVCEFGVYVFEAKDWFGGITKSDAYGKLTIMDFEGNSKDRSDPLPSTIGKMELLGNNLSVNTHCKAVVVITDQNGMFHPRLATSYLHINDIPYFFRVERDNSSKTLDLELTKREVFGQLDPSPTAKHDHMMRLTPDADNIKKYHANQAEIEVLMSRPNLGYTPQGKPMWWISGALVSILFAGTAYAFYPPMPVENVAAGAKAELNGERAIPVVSAKKPAKHTKNKAQVN